MDPTRAPDFKPTDSKSRPEPPPDPTSTIPKSSPIVPYVLADYNASIDAPFNLDTGFKDKAKVKSRSYVPPTSSFSTPRHQHHRGHRSAETRHQQHQQEKDKRRASHIPLNVADFQPLSAEMSSTEEDTAEDIEDGDIVEGIDTMLYLEDDLEREEKQGVISVGVRKNQIADLEEVPHGIVRQARSLDDYEFPTHRLAKKLNNPNKMPLVVVACGSFSPITYLHLRMFEMALDAIREQTRFEVIGGYYSPVSDNYQKPGLAAAVHRVRMCELACERTSSWLMVDAWESLQPTYTRTAKVLDHFNYEVNVKRGGVSTITGEKMGVKIMLLAGGDLIESMGEPNVWADADLHHILGNYGCLILERTGSDVRSFLLSHDIMYEHRRNVLVIKQLIYNDISSTKVRLFLRRNMSVQYLLPNSVIRYIQEHGLYVNQTEPVKQVMGSKG
ncbi:NMA2 (YGR010W) and NMA1 (YLR328W) [Zygosaccharomyces parabailii]|nr:NMA2 (YGR010W) and NMA1 (YLR328W) [Zygosaccharomyces parabailii]CDH15450.1 probable Nicotinamide-nucleotide adenylyltransferase 1 [Zygosaccharomyces bailii ISA1307]